MTYENAKGEPRTFQREREDKPRTALGCSVLRRVVLRIVRALEIALPTPSLCKLASNLGISLRTPGLHLGLLRPLWVRVPWDALKVESPLSQGLLL